MRVAMSRGLLQLMLLAAVCAAPAADPDTYDYIVVGSGPGGGPLACNLARAGHKTLLMEAGDDETSDPSSNVAAFFVSTGIHDNLHWDFFVRHYDDMERTLKFEHLVWKLPSGDLWVGPGKEAPKGAELLGVNYPRGATLGGSTVINAGAVFLPSDSDWDYVANITGDKTWNAGHMRELFIKLENNAYLPRGTPGHGFDGYLPVTIGDGSAYLNSPQSPTVLGAMMEELGLDPKNLKQSLIADPNFLDPKRDWTEGLWALPFHVNTTWGRYSARERIISTVKAGFPLHLQLNSLASKILFDESTERPRAIGVEFLEGKSLYKGDPRYKGTKGTSRKLYASKEVIISGGAFNSPQILKLSGIGEAAELRKFNISVVANLPGVGTNMQDNQEIAIVGLAPNNFTITMPEGVVGPACTFGTPGDPCYDLWLKNEGPYTGAGPNSDIFLKTTKYTPDGERDMTVFSGPFTFHGFWPQTPNQTWYIPPNTWGMQTVKMHPQNRKGTVRLTSADPTDMPDINFHLFSEGADIDIGAMKDIIAWGRRAFQRVKAPIGPFELAYPPCPAGVKADGTCSDPNSDEEWIRSNTFGHHVTSSVPIGGDGDKMAVLDSKFRVRGVDALRVVDASAFPRCPGSFPVIATYILSEKASESVLEDAK